MNVDLNKLVLFCQLEFYLQCRPKNVRQKFLTTLKYSILTRRFGVNFINILMRALFIWKCFAELFSSYVLGKKALLYEKRTRKMLMKLTPDLNDVKCSQDTNCFELRQDGLNLRALYRVIYIFLKNIVFIYSKIFFYNFVINLWNVAEKKQIFYKCLMNAKHCC